MVPTVAGYLSMSMYILSLTAVLQYLIKAIDCSVQIHVILICYKYIYHNSKTITNFTFNLTVLVALKHS